MRFPYCLLFYKLNNAKSQTVFMRFLWAHFLSLSRFPWMTSPLSVVSAALLSFVSANLLRMHSMPPSVIKENIEEHQSQDRTLRDTTCHWPPPGHRNHCSQSPGCIQPANFLTTKWSNLQTHGSPIWR